MVDEYLAAELDDEHIDTYSSPNTAFLNVFVGLIIGVFCGCYGNSRLKCFKHESEKKEGSGPKYGSLATTVEVVSKEDCHQSNTELTKATIV